MNDDNRTIINWINLGIVCGFIVSVIYPLLQFISNLVLGVILAASMGILLSLASVGLFYFIQIHKKTITVKIALIANIIAGTLLAQMFLVQLAIKSSKPIVIDESSKWIWSSLNHIHYGLDVAWDVYIFIGTFLFAINAYNHPKLGKTLSIIGILISLAMIVTNVLAFPIPPDAVGSIDFGPFIGLWYLAITIKITFSRKWINQQLI
ncbi:MAG: hypothetical protein KJO12_01440 [Ignavibacteria bacterium]|nr:hypothetical protein [Ignavibacteria bacterium]